MSDFCPCCDNFSMDSLRATRGLVEKPKKKKKTKKKTTDISVDKKAKIVINVDNADENADWIKQVRDGSDNQSSKEHVK
jgi:hypothetical protein